MNTASFIHLLPFLAAAAGLALAGLLVAKHRHNGFDLLAALVLTTSSVIQCSNGLSIADEVHAPFWRRLALVGELAQPVALLYAGLAVMHFAGLHGTAGLRRRAHAVAIVALVLGSLAWTDHTLASQDQTGNVWLHVLGPLGRLDYMFIVLALALALGQLESLLRSSREPIRYQLKFVLIGLGALGGYQIYEASRILLVPILKGEDVWVGGIATLGSIGLMAYGFSRSQLRDMTSKVYVSPQVLYGSLTFLVIGSYLFGVGVLSQFIRHTGQSIGLALSELVIFLAMIGLVVVLASRAARGAARQFICRHVYRSKYDYRAKWLEVTDAFRQCESAETLLDCLLQVLSSTLRAPRISIWMHVEADGRFHQIRSVNAELPPRPLDTTHPVVVRLMSTDEPIGMEQWASGEDLDVGLDGFWDATRAALCVPIRCRNRLLAFVALSSEGSGASYGADDRHLLRVISHHVGMLLSLTYLAEEQRASAELDAVHRLSAFCLHDLKNLAARLSLVAQNAQIHGHEPAFQHSAMRMISGTAQKMMALMTKLEPQSRDVRIRDEGQWELADVQSVLAETVDAVSGALRIPVRWERQAVSPVMIKRDQLHQVFLNVLLNAQQACGTQGEIAIRTTRNRRSIVITVSDTGPGIPSSHLLRLFKPFQTTKSDGLGVGLYECKQIVESHQGAMHIESAVGLGTSVAITLPLATEDSISLSDNLQEAVV